MSPGEWSISQISRIIVPKGAGAVFLLNGAIFVMNYRCFSFGTGLSSLGYGLVVDCVHQFWHGALPSDIGAPEHGLVVDSSAGGGEDHVALGFEHDGGASSGVLVGFGEHEPVALGCGDGDGFPAGGVDDGDAVAAFGAEALDVVPGELGSVRFAGRVEAGGRRLVHAVPCRADGIGPLRIALLEDDQDLVADLRIKQHAPPRTRVRRHKAHPGGLVVLLPDVLHTDPALVMRCCTRDLLRLSGFFQAM